MNKMEAQMITLSGAWDLLRKFRNGQTLPKSYADDLIHYIEIKARSLAFKPKNRIDLITVQNIAREMGVKYDKER